MVWESLVGGYRAAIGIKINDKHGRDRPSPNLIRTYEYPWLTEWVTSCVFKLANTKLTFPIHYVSDNYQS